MTKKKKDEDDWGDESDAVKEFPSETPDPTAHIFIEKGETLVLHPAPEGWNRDYRLNLHGKNFEHVSEGENGVWVYRRM